MSYITIRWTLFYFKVCQKNFWQVRTIVLSKFQRTLPSSTRTGQHPLQSWKDRPLRRHSQSLSTIFFKNFYFFQKLANFQRARFSRCGYNPILKIVPPYCPTRFQNARKIFYKNCRFFKISCVSIRCDQKNFLIFSSDPPKKHKKRALKNAKNIQTAPRERPIGTKKQSPRRPFAQCFQFLLKR